MSSGNVSAAQHYIDNDTVNQSYITGRTGIWSYINDGGGPLYNDYRWVATLEYPNQKYSWACNYGYYGYDLHVVSVFLQTPAATGIASYYWNSLQIRRVVTQKTAKNGWNEIWHSPIAYYNPSKGVLLEADTPYVCADGMYLGDNN